MKKRIEDDPDGLVTEYVNEEREELGAEGLPFSLADYGKIPWGRLRIPHKVFVLLVHIFKF